MCLHNSYLWLVLCIVSACQQTPSAPLASPTPEIAPSTTHSEQVVRQLFEHFNKHQWEAMAALYADTATFRDPSLGIDLVQQTRQETITKYRELEKMVPDVKDELTAVHACGDQFVTVEFLSTGTGPDGKPFRLPICAVLKVENGKITQDFTYYDNF